MFTGMHANNTGAFSFYPWAHHRSWVHDLADVGYRCVNIGKMHLDPRDDPYAFHERVIVENPSRAKRVWGEIDDAWARYLWHHGKERIGLRHETDPDWRSRFQAVPWHMEEQFHPDVFVGNSAADWVRHHDLDEPLFLQVGFTGVHEPYDPLPRHAEEYRNTPVPEPLRRDNELADKPPQQRAHVDFNNRFHHESQIAMPEARHEDILHMRRHYYAKVTTVDEQIGKVLDALENRGYLDNAVVIFTSDHGDMLGDHHMPYKWFMYENVVNVPLIIWDTRDSAPEAREAPIADLVSLVDIGPTVLDYAGVEPPRFLEGHSLAGYLRGAAHQPRDFVVAQDNYMTMIRTQEAKLVWYAHQEHDGELYDLREDPHELFNRYNDAGYRSLREELMHRLLTWSMRSAYQTAGHKNGRSWTPQLWPQESTYVHNVVKARPNNWADF